MDIGQKESLDFCVDLDWFLAPEFWSVYDPGDTIQMHVSTDP